MTVQIATSFFLFALPAVTVTSLAEVANLPQKKVYPTVGRITAVERSLIEIVPEGAQIEKLAGGFIAAEGPLWDDRSGTLLFSDPPRNVVFQWKPGVGTRDFLYPSGYTGATKRSGMIGSAGMCWDLEANLVLCQLGNRQIVRLRRQGGLEALARYYRLRRLNSPHDVVMDRFGVIYFTDPPVALSIGEKDPSKELVFNGLYRLDPHKEEPELLTDELSMPWCLALTPDGKELLVTVADKAKPAVYKYRVGIKGIEGRLSFIETKTLCELAKDDLPRGVCIDFRGNVFLAIGKGGLVILPPEGGRIIGRIETDGTILDCSIGKDEDGTFLYLTGTPFIYRLKLLQNNSP